MVANFRGDGNFFDPDDHVIEIITPEIAKRYLATLKQGESVFQRGVSSKVVRQIASDIKNGRWNMTHQGIAFNTDGVLVDGQHRLHAVVVANMPIQIRVFRNQPRATMAYIDTGTRRDLTDTLRTMGHRFNNDHTATLNAAIEINPYLHPKTGQLTGSANRKPSQDQMIQLAINHFEGLKFAVKKFGNPEDYGQVYYAAYRAVVFRAYCCEVNQRDRLLEFLKALYSNPVNRDQSTYKEDVAAYLLREHHLHLKNKDNTTGGKMRALNYCLAQDAVVKFLNREKVKKLEPIYTQVFQLVGFDPLDDDLMNGKQLKLPI